jgi:hypothetical protein
MQELIYEPSFWSATIIVFGLVPAIFGMLIGTPKGRSKEVIWANRGIGVDIVFVLLPFIFYAIGNILNGMYAKFMSSPELPMAAMILFALTIFSMLKGLSASASTGNIATEAFLVGTLLSILLMLSCGAYISWLAFSQQVSPWFGVFNSILIIFAVTFTFAINAAMAYVSKYPERFGGNSSTER